MFKKNYTQAFDCIKPDDALKDQILSKLESRKNQKRNPALPWRVGFAVAAAAAIALSVIFIPKNNTVSNLDTPPLTLSATDSYSEVYRMLSKYKTSVKAHNFLNGFGTKTDDYVIEYEYVAEDGGGSTSASGTEKKSSADAASKEESDTVRGEDYSETTAQVAGVAEADIVKTDGKHIYALIGSQIKIYTAKGRDSELLSVVELEDAKGKYSFGEMFLNGNLLTLIQTVWYDGKSEYSSVVVYDIANPENPTQKYACRQQGNYNSSRMIGNFVYIITDYNINTNNISRGDPATYVPSVICKGEAVTVPADSIYCYSDDITSARYSVIGAYDITTGELTSSVSLLGGTDTIYCSTDNIIIADVEYTDEPNADKEEVAVYNSSNTLVSRIAVSDGKLEYKCSGTVGGTLENQFFIDEFGQNFRFVTTVEETTRKSTYFANSDKEIMTYSNRSFARLTVLDGDLKEIGRLDRIAEGERVYSVRFMGEIAYFVTFRQTDPLFSVDLSDPKNPKLLSALKIPGFSEYMYPYGDGLLLGFGMEADEKTGRTSFLKLSMFDTSDPADLKEQDKTVISPFTYSEALYNHKAMLVSVNKNLIGFAANDNNMNLAYMLYEYTGDGFTQKAAFDLETDDAFGDCTDVRGMFIDDNFYIISPNALWCFDLSDFTQLAMIKG